MGLLVGWGGAAPRLGWANYAARPALPITAWSPDFLRPWSDRSPAAGPFTAGRERCETGSRREWRISRGGGRHEDANRAHPAAGGIAGAVHPGQPGPGPRTG